MIGWPVVALLALAGADPPDAADPSRGAGGLRLLVVPPAGASSERVEAVYAGLRDVGLAPVGLLERAGVDLPVEGRGRGRATIDDVREAFLRARAGYRALEMDDARAALDDALDAAVRLDAPHVAKDLVADLLLLRAEVAIVEGRDDDARRELLLLTRLDHDRAELNPGLYAPALVDAYADARRVDLESPTGFLSVLPRVAGGAEPEVVLDGVAVPRGARERMRPKTGPHLLTVRAEGVPSASRIVDVDEQQPISFEPFLAPEGADQERAALVDAIRRGGGGEPALARLCALSAAGAAVVIVDDEPRLFVPGRGLAALAARADDEPLTIGRSALAALRAPFAEEVEARVDPAGVLVGVGVGAGVLVALGGLTGVAVWQLWPHPSPAPPPPPAPFSCCN